MFPSLPLHVMASLNQLLTIPPVDQGAMNGLVRKGKEQERKHKHKHKHKKRDINININIASRSGLAAETVLVQVQHLLHHQILKGARDQICSIP